MQSIAGQAGAQVRRFDVSRDWRLANMKSPSWMPDKSSGMLRSQKPRKWIPRYGHELAPGPARKPELARNRLHHHPHRFHRRWRFGGAFYALGRQFWSLAGPYFSFRRSWRPLLVFALLLVLTLFSVRLNVLFSFWYNGFYSALQALDQTAFWYLLGVFAVLATIHVLRSLFTYYVTQAFNIDWRVWLTERLTADWMKGDAYYRGRFLAEPVDNPDQRIELDVNAFVTGSVSLALGAVSALVSLVAFTAILWGCRRP